ncbi:hypothetical protein BJ166DRAFT_74570 [Pestalotiopsis sp. NC0098]|nr:hypothetical protein BJ166DRAFT_74570 [Pestalotiopsis sp. NC0098]
MAILFLAFSSRLFRPSCCYGTCSRPTETREAIGFPLVRGKMMHSLAKYRSNAVSESIAPEGTGITHHNIIPASQAKPYTNQPECSSRIVNEAIMGHAGFAIALGAHSLPSYTQMARPAHFNRRLI